MQLKRRRVPAKQGERNVLIKILGRVIQLELLIEILQPVQARSLEVLKVFANNAPQRVVRRRSESDVIPGHIDGREHREHLDVSHELIVIGLGAQNGAAVQAKRKRERQEFGHSDHRSAGPPRNETTVSLSENLGTSPRDEVSNRTCD